MAVTLSIRDVPDDVAERFRARARANHRSLQGELLATLKEIATEKPAASKILAVAEDIRRLDLPRPKHNESAGMIRNDRDNR